MSTRIGSVNSLSLIRDRLLLSDFRIQQRARDLGVRRAAVDLPLEAQRLGEVLRRDRVPEAHGDAAELMQRVCEQGPGREKVLKRERGLAGRM